MVGTNVGCDDLNCVGDGVGGLVGLGGRVTMGLAGASSAVASFVEGEAVLGVSLTVDVDVDDGGGGGGTFDSVGRFVGCFTSAGVDSSFSSAQSAASIQENPSLQKKSSPS